MRHKDYYLPCRCGCTLLHVTWLPEEEEFWFTQYELGYYSHQATWKNYFKRLWSAIRGRMYPLFELNVTEHEAFLFAEWLEERIYAHLEDKYEGKEEAEHD